ncbi:MAG: class I SAM-dependent methyltransferase [Leptolyngbyaceae cyanobacterium SM1_3_5]|nr:class I SAM-dependent methyltransferase [Leptolyngbyaceae cyanobacterium SM1_3_5]
MGGQYCQNQLRPLERLLLSKLAPNAKLLDLCCGTGQLVEMLAQQGYQVTGLDGSEAMLHYAQQNAPQAQFVLADARSFQLPPLFDAVFSTSASLNHIMTLDNLKAVFQSVHASLQSNGLFLFDLNHPAQMEKWWGGQVAEGEIAVNYAWSITPMYDAIDRTGYFQVAIFQAPQAEQINLFKGSIYRLLNLSLLTRLRLKVLSQFQNWEQNWQRSSIRYSVRGHTVEEVESALKSVGFTEISVQTIDGDPAIDANHSAYFLCCKST